MAPTPPAPSRRVAVRRPIVSAGMSSMTFGNITTDIRIVSSNRSEYGRSVS
jgi:hypothetical protein